MAEIKINDLTAYTSPVSTDVLPIVDVGNDVTKKVSIADLVALAAVSSVNTQTGAVVLDADDISDSSTTNKFATATQLTDIGTAVQPGDLATVATTGAYSDLSGTPTIPAPAPVDSVNTQTGAVVLDADDIDDTSTTHKFATAAQLTSIGTAVQPGDLATVATSGSYNDLSNQPTIPAAAPVDSVNTLTGAVVLDADDIDDTSTTHKFATAAQLTDIGTAVQPGDLATVATSGAYGDLSGTPATAVPAAGGTFTGDVEFDGDIAADGVYTGAVTAVGALAIDCSSSNYFTKTINGNSTFTFTNVPSTRAFGFTLELTHTSGTVTWPASVKFPADTAPTLTTGKTHIFVFVTDDGGTRFRGAALVDYTN